MAYVSNGNVVPFWLHNGFVELLSNNQTVDFVRFGNNTVTPTTASAWPAATNVAISNAAPIGSSMVRPPSNLSNTHTAADWEVVPFGTPGGLNDVRASATDLDNDGIPDSAEQPGGTFAGIDYYSMGARSGRRDIFIEIHTMDQNPLATADYGFILQKGALDLIVASFNKQNISVHFDAGNKFSATFNPALYNLGGGNSAGSIPFKPCTDLGYDNSGFATARTQCNNFYTIKNSLFDVKRRAGFHYMLMANSQETSGLSGSSGVAEYKGNDILITLGGNSLNLANPTVANITTNLQASTIMHELGHNLGLDHGGDNGVNNKPNYISIMNYMYQIYGLPSTFDTHVVMDRYKAFVLENKSTTPISLNYYCAMSNSFCGTQYLIDYSNGSSASMNENALVESLFMGRGNIDNSYADWNDNGIKDTLSYSFNVTADIDGLYTNLTDYNDWANLLLPFARTYNGALYHGRAFNAPNNQIVLAKNPSSPMKDYHKQWITERGLPVRALSSIRSGLK
jgi:hypothetical protein